MLFLFFSNIVRIGAPQTFPFMERGTTPVPSIGEILELVKTVSSNGRVRGKPQRHGFESHASSFIFCLNIVKRGASETCPFMEK